MDTSTLIIYSQIIVIKLKTGVTKSGVHETTGDIIRQPGLPNRRRCRALFPQRRRARLQDAGLLHGDRAAHLRRPHGHGGADRRLHLPLRVQVGQIRRGGVGADRGEGVRLVLRPRPAQALQNRGELLLRDSPDPELEGSGTVTAYLRAMIPTATYPLQCGYTVFCRILLCKSEKNVFLREKDRR